MIIKHRRKVIGRINTMIGAICGLLDEIVLIITLGSIDIDLKLKWMFSELSINLDCN